MFTSSSKTNSKTNSMTKVRPIPLNWNTRNTFRAVAMCEMNAREQGDIATTFGESGWAEVVPGSKYKFCRDADGACGMVMKYALFIDFPADYVPNFDDEHFKAFASGPRVRSALPRTGSSSKNKPKKKVSFKAALVTIFPTKTPHILSKSYTMP
jgi:hypothetical protein